MEGLFCRWAEVTKRIVEDLENFKKLALEASAQLAVSERLEHFAMVPG